MHKNIIRWATAIGALSRILALQDRMQNVPSYFERMRLVNDALGANWVFRLAETVGIDIIRANRPSWVNFYVDDTEGVHAPLDPGAPETLKFLGVDYSIKDMAFYGGMGFAGYQLALQTKRSVNRQDGTMEFDDQYYFAHESVAELCQRHFAIGDIAKETYYNLYAQALDAIFDNCRQLQVPQWGESAFELAERTAGAALMLLCGGHKGCAHHKDKAERFDSQIESLVIFSYVRMVAKGEISFSDTERALHAVA